MGLYGVRKRRGKGRRTGDATVEADLDAIATRRSTREVQRLMKVAHEMNEELKCLLRAFVPLLKPHRRVPYRAEDVDARRALPPLLAEDALLRGVVADAVDVVHLGGPAHLVLELVGPACYGG